MRWLRRLRIRRLKDYMAEMDSVTPYLQKAEKEYGSTYYTDKLLQHVRLRSQFQRKYEALTKEES